MGDDSTAHQQLIDELISHPDLKGAEKRKKLLLFLWSKRVGFLQAKVIENECYETDINSPHFNEARSRVACDDLRLWLEKQAAVTTDADWICALPKVEKGVAGYKLTFTKRVKQVARTVQFWQPHLETIDKTIVIGGWRLFFFDPSKNKVFRYYDFNEDTSDDSKLLNALHTAHPEDHSPDLRPQRDFYLAAGDIHAFEILQRWFHQQKNVLLTRFISRGIQEGKIHKYSPILLGRPATNRFIERFMKHLRRTDFGYRFYSTLGAVEISNIRPNEVKDLSPYPLTGDGILGPVPKWEKAFGIVTRFANPGGLGFVTVIAADFHSLVTSQIADSLTDEKWMTALFARTGWDQRGIPNQFEMLFAVPISPGGMEGEGQPELLTWRG